MTDPKTIKSIRKVPLSMRALHALKMQRKQVQKAGLLENHTIDGHSGFVFLREDGQLLNAGRLDLLIHRIVYECNARKVANAIKTDTEPELLPNISPTYSGILPVPVWQKKVWIKEPYRRLWDTGIWHLP